MVEPGVQTVGVESDQLGQPVLGFAELLGHGRVLVLFQSLAQVAEGEFERCIPAGVVEHQAAFEGFAEAGAGMVGVEDAEEAGQAGGHGLGKCSRVLGCFVHGAEETRGLGDAGQGELDEAVRGFHSDEGRGEVVVGILSLLEQAAAAGRRETRASNRRTVASAGTNRLGSTGSGRTPSRSRTCAGASAIHSPTASSEVAPASTAHAVSASTTASACRTPRGSRGSGTWASRSSRPGTSPGATPRCSRSWSRARGIGDDASADTVFLAVAGR